MLCSVVHASLGLPIEQHHRSLFFYILIAIAFNETDDIATTTKGRTDMSLISPVIQ